MMRFVRYILAIVPFFMVRMVASVCAQPLPLDSCGAVEGVQLDSLSLLRVSRPDSLARRPKVALVLSGGGARGFIHIGLLRVLEEEGILPDYIVGTSMGAVLGSLYSMGYNAEQLSELGRDVDWAGMLSNNLDLRAVSIDQKPHLGRSVLSLHWRKGSLRLPLGLVEGQNLWNFLERSMWSAVGINEFNQLPIPFRACAVDLFAGRNVYFDRGNLVKAVRASMAIPGVFTPVSYGDTAVLVDGGVADNISYDAAVALGADIIIGSYAGPPLMTPEEVDLFGTTDVLKQASMYAALVKIREDRGKFDLFFAPNLKGISSMVFSHAARIEQYGYDEASKQRDEFRELATRLRAQGVPAQRQGRLGPPTKRYVDRLEVTGVSPEMRTFAIERMNLHLPDSLDAGDIERAIERLYGSLYFERVIYTIEGSTLRIEASMQDKVHLDLSYQVNEVWGLGVTARLRVLNPMASSSRFTLEVGASYHPHVQLDLTQYFSQRYGLLFNFKAQYNSSRFPIYVEASRIASMWQHEVLAEMSVGKTFGNSAILTLGTSFQHRNLNPSDSYVQLLLVDDPGQISSQSLNLFTFFRYDSFDRPYFPRVGCRLESSLSYRYLAQYGVSDPGDSWSMVGINREFKDSKFGFKAFVDCSGYLPLARALTMELGLSAGLAYQGPSRYSSFFVGGGLHMARPGEALPFYGLAYRMTSYHAIGLARLGFRFEAWPDLFIGPVVNALTGRRAQIVSWEDFQELWQDWKVGTGLRVGWLTRFGLLEASVGVSTDSAKPWFYFTAGYPF